MPPQQRFLVQMYSGYKMPLLGDLVVAFSQNVQVPEFPVWTFITLSIGVLLATIFYKRITPKYVQLT
jgi:hypothetical protein